MRFHASAEPHEYVQAFLSVEKKKKLLLPGVGYCYRKLPMDKNNWFCCKVQGFWSTPELKTVSDFVAKFKDFGPLLNWKLFLILLQSSRILVRSWTENCFSVSILVSDKTCNYAQWLTPKWKEIVTSLEIYKILSVIFSWITLCYSSLQPT